MAGLKLFFDAFSQPSRAVWMLLEMTKTPFQPNLVNIAKGDNRSEEFLKISPNKTVPAIDDNGFYLFESAAIMKYCVDKYNLPDHWYPKDIQRRAKIDEYLSWHNGNLRLGAAGYMYYKYIAKRLTGKEVDEKSVADSQKMLYKSMRILEEGFLKSSPFINSDEITVADIQAVCEFSQFLLADIDILGDKPTLEKWMDNCKEKLQPHFDTVHAMIYLAREKGAFKDN
jgi:glutathione S-transferase